jgi:LEA14-like dessication related protein
LGEYITRLYTDHRKRVFENSIYRCDVFAINPAPLYISGKEEYCMPIEFWPLAPAMAGVVISGCGLLLKDPEISIKGLSLSSASMSTLELDIRVGVENRNPVGITLKTLSFDVYYQNGGEWVFLSHGEEAGIVIQSGTNEVNIPVMVRNTGILGSLANLVTKGEVTLQIRGVASPQVFGISRGVPFTETLTIPLWHSET